MKYALIYNSPCDDSELVQNLRMVERLIPYTIAFTAVLLASFFEEAVMAFMIKAQDGLDADQLKFDLENPSEYSDL